MAHNLRGRGRGNVGTLIDGMPPARVCAGGGDGSAARCESINSLIYSV
jgi:hypothetical protein